MMDHSPRAAYKQLLSQAAGLTMRFEDALRVNADTQALIREVHALVDTLRAAASEANWPTDLSIECRGWMHQLNACVREVVRRQQRNLLSYAHRAVVDTINTAGLSRGERLWVIDAQIAVVQSLDRLSEDERGTVLNWFDRMASTIRKRDEDA
jgi:hypothetical protein